MLKRFTIINRLRIMVAASMMLLCLATVPGWLGLQATTFSVRKIHDDFSVAASALGSVEADMYRARMALMIAIAIADDPDNDRLLKSLETRFRNMRESWATHHATGAARQVPDQAAIAAQTLEALIETVFAPGAAALGARDLLLAPENRKLLAATREALERLSKPRRRTRRRSTRVRSSGRPRLRSRRLRYS